ncbi:TonB-dependent receptor [Sphingomonas sp. AP4-R1]|uniref:TonB-dependent receptor n=1 Tax=Sphingomonas sp. AP4-R1 TaxID=2735134 RepID=UPI00149339EE|nr:TonB-dependent receptor [Sphingomonas sp. AP4-R1]QJU59857.1 TonB-dependent receptor [Sphingomonas sp. AP4-R1]
MLKKGRRLSGQFTTSSHLVITLVGLCAATGAVAQAVAPETTSTPLITAQPQSGGEQTSTSDQPVSASPDVATQSNTEDRPEKTHLSAEEARKAEDILVVGTRASLRSAINRKRNADTVVDSIVADDIASFPDKNVGESLARITGVQLSRDFGEGTQVSIRGVEPDLNRIEINGVSQQSSEGTRGGDFRELATELVKSIDVYKGYSADLTEGGLGGTVQIETRKPLELAKPLASVVASGQYAELQQKWRPRATLVAGTPHFLLDGLGILGTVTYSDVLTRQDYISNTNWNRDADFDHSDQKTVADPLYANFGTYASCANVGGTSTANATSRRLACETQFFDWAPRVPRYRTLNRYDKRISADVSLQYEIASNLRVYGEAQVNNRNNRLSDVNYSLDMGRFQRYNLDPTLPAGLNGGTSRPQVQTGTSTVDANHVVTSYLTARNVVNIGTAAAPVYSGAANIVGVQRRNFKNESRSQYYTGGAEWNLDRLQVKALLSHAEGRNINNTNLVSYGTSVSGITVDRRNDAGVPGFIFPSTFDASDPSVYSDATRRDPAGNLLPVSGPTVQYRPIDNSNRENQLKLDADWKVNLPFLKMIEAGTQIRSQYYQQYNGGGTQILTPATGTTAAVFQSSANVSYTTNIVPTVTQRNNGSTYFMTPAEYASFVSANSGVTGGAPLFSGLSGLPSGIPTRLAIPLFNTDALSKYYDLSGFDQDIVKFADGKPQIPAYKISEDITAAYLKGDYEFRVWGMRVTGNAGVRYIHTKDNGTGTNRVNITRFTATGGTETVPVSAESRTLKNSYTDWLPAFNMALEITPNLVVRANWAKNLARPKPTDLVPNINCTDDTTILLPTEDVCTAGNPNLQPYRANQWEFNAAWYPNRDTMVSLGYYRKNEKSFVIAAQTIAGVDLFGDGTLYTVRQPINGFGAVLDGVEASAQTVFSFLPAPFDGFGASGNITFARAIKTNLTNSATGAELKEYPGLSKWTYNASIFYDKGFLNARLNYNFRSDWLVSVLDANNGNNPIYRKGEGYLDGKITFRFFHQKFSAFVEAQNILKEKSESFIKNLAPVEIYYPGRRFFAGVQYKL